MTVNGDTTIDPEVANELRLLVEQMYAVAEAIGTDVQEAVRLASEYPLPADRARLLYSRVLVILRSAGVNIDDAARARTAAEVEEEVERFVGEDRPPISAATQAASTSSASPIELVSRNGLDPHPVRPIPEFNGKRIAVEEGYVDVTRLELWKGNHRLELAVGDFRNRWGREPDADELLGILQGKVILSSLTKKDPFSILALARSIARKGVERPPIVTWEGSPMDGNRRISAAKYVVEHPEEFNEDERDRARWIRVWRCPPGTTLDEVEAIVVALNFEPELKVPWDEYIKARRVAEKYEEMKSGLGRVGSATLKRIREQVAGTFAIRVTDVQRYLRMVDWATDFEQYHIDERGRGEAEVRYRANDIFQWFYEIDAGRGNEKLTKKLDRDDQLKAVVYDLMYDVLDSGAQVRALYKVVDDDEAIAFLNKAHETLIRAPSGDPEALDLARSHALELVEDALEEVKRKGDRIRKSRITFDSWLRTAVERFGGTAPDYWRNVDTGLLTDLQRVLTSALGIISGELQSRSHADAAEQ